MHKRKKLHLQRHRIKAFTATLDQLEARISGKIQFIEYYNDLYRFPGAITRRSLVKYRRWLKAAQTLLEMEFKDVQ